MSKHSLWVERYRPTKLAHVILENASQAEKIAKFVRDGEIPNLLISGVQGTGKSTISRVLINELKVDPSDVLRINCSDKKVDALRNAVTNFATTMALGAFKVVQLEELEYSSPEAMALLRGLIEDTSSNCRYIATCNYVNRIMPPLRSRFQEFSFVKPDKELIICRMIDILEQEQIQFDPEDLFAYVDVGYPDIRHTIQLLQGNSVDGKLLSVSNAKSDVADWKFQLIEHISTGNFKAARLLVCSSASREEHEEIFTFLYSNIDKMKLTSMDEAIVKIAEYLYRHSFCADTEINLAALFIELGALK